VVTETPKVLSTGVKPNVAPQIVTVLAPAAISAEAVRTILLPTRAWLAAKLEPTAPVVSTATKPAGNKMVMKPPLGTRVAVVNATTILRLVVAEILSAVAIVNAPPVTMPPRATDAPTPARSVVDDTWIPGFIAGMGPPIVAPVRVSVIAPAATSAVVATMYWGAVPVVAVAKPVPAAAMVPVM